MLSQDDYLKAIDLRPLVSIDLILQNSEGQILLGLRKNNPAQGSWFVPGGVIYKNEKQAEALARISNRELGFIIANDDTELLGVYEHFYDTNFAEAPNITTHYVVIGRSFQLPTSQEISMDDQHEALEWWDIDALLASRSVHQYTKNYFIK